MQKQELDDMISNLKDQMKNVDDGKVAAKGVSNPFTSPLDYAYFFIYEFYLYLTCFMLNYLFLLFALPSAAIDLQPLPQCDSGRDDHRDGKGVSRGPLCLQELQRPSWHSFLLRGGG